MDERTTKELWRRCVRAMHPDLADDDAGRRTRHAWMTAVNDARNDRDAERLTALLEQWKHRRTADERPRPPQPDPAEERARRERDEWRRERQREWDEAREARTRRTDRANGTTPPPPADPQPHAAPAHAFTFRRLAAAVVAIHVLVIGAERGPDAWTALATGWTALYEAAADTATRTPGTDAGQDAASTEDADGLYRRAAALSASGRYTAAAPLYVRAAEAGHAAAQAMAGVVHEAGLGVHADTATAVHWYGLAARQGNTLAQTGLGTAYLRGKGVPQDLQRARELYETAAAAGSATAAGNLGALYETGTGVDADPAAAARWYARAAELRNPWARTQLDRLRQEAGSDRTQATDDAGTSTDSLIRRSSRTVGEWSSGLADRMRDSWREHVATSRVHVAARR